MHEPLRETPFEYPFLSGGGQMGKLIRSVNWSENPLGLPAGWPVLLKHTVSMMLKNSFPTFISWGTDQIQLYNDAFYEVVGQAQHMEAPGISARLNGSEIWNAIGPMLMAALLGQTRSLSNLQLTLDRNAQKETCFFDFSFSPITDIDGQIHGVLVFFNETMERVNAVKLWQAIEAERKHKDEELQLIIDKLPASVVMIRGEDLRVEMINQSNLDYWNKTASEVIGKPFLDILPDLADQPFAGQLRHVIATGEVIDVKESPVIFEKADGTTRETFVDYTYQPLIDSKGVRDGVLVMSSEITERVIARKLLEQYAEELEKANADLYTLNNDLARSEARFKYLIQEAPVAIGVLHSRQLIIESANDVILKIWGKNKSIVGTPLSAALPELQGQPFLDILDHVFTTGQPFFGNEVYAMLEREGTLQETYLNFVYQPVADSRGEMIDILIVAVDVTAQVEARAALQQINEEMAAANEELATTNEELTEMQDLYQATNRELENSASRLRMAIESTSLGTWEYNPQTNELYWSKECRDVYGIPENEVPTFKDFSAHINPADRNRVEAEIIKAMNPAGEGSYDVTYRIARFDTGESRWIRAQGNVYFDGEVAARFIGTVLDINELKLAEEESAKLAAIIATSNDAIISKTFDSIITSWNESAARIFGYSAGEMIGESIYKLIPTDRHHEEPRILATIKRGEQIDHFETQRLTKSGRLIDVSVTISPVKDKDGQIIGLSKIARDITEKKLDEARKNDFIGMVSHELKTPLTSLAAIIQVANKKLEYGDDRFLSGAMGKADRQVKRMTALINGFLNISRLESGKIHIEKSQFDLSVLINEVISEINLSLSTHLIQFEDNAISWVNADRNKINSVVSNLISNAIKYSPDGGHITIDCKATHDEVTVSIKDVGIGIKPKDLEQIFNRYYRVESSDTKHISGFGIGLYLSAEIVKHHGGKLWAESQVGVGSTFSFSLPFN